VVIAYRLARIDELDIICDIDRDASQLFERAGLVMTPQEELELAAVERNRWLGCLQSGSTLLANRSGEPVGFAALGLLDGAGYLEQLSVRMDAMRQGIGTALLTAIEEMAEKKRAPALWLTTWAHLPWNRPFYEKAGFSIVPEEEWGREMRQQLVFERRLLPVPEKRVVMRKALGTSM
jgi:GNAT superfamily N-acetyltransferase